jgi:hypothetical protein
MAPGRSVSGETRLAGSGSTELAEVLALPGRLGELCTPNPERANYTRCRVRQMSPPARIVSI